MLTPSRQMQYDASLWRMSTRHLLDDFNAVSEHPANFPVRELSLERVQALYWELRLRFFKQDFSPLPLVGNVI